MRDDHGASGVAAVDQLDEAVGFLGAEGQIAHFVTDEKPRSPGAGELLSELS